MSNGGESETKYVDAVFTDHVVPDPTTGGIRGTRTEKYTLTAAGHSDPACADAAREDERFVYKVVGVPTDRLRVEDRSFSFVGPYTSTLDVVSSKGSTPLEPATRRLMDKGLGDTTTGSCEMGGRCKVRWHRDFSSFGDSIIDVDLVAKDGVLTGSASSTSACVGAMGDGTDSSIHRTDDGYDSRTTVSLYPVVVETGVATTYVTRVQQTSVPRPTAKAEFPRDCGTTESTDIYYYSVLTSLYE